MMSDYTFFPCSLDVGICCALHAFYSLFLPNILGRVLEIQMPGCGCTLDLEVFLLLRVVVEAGYLLPVHLGLASPKGRVHAQSTSTGRVRLRVQYIR